MRVARHRGKGQTASPAAAARLAAPLLVREAAPSHRHIPGERNLFPYRRPRGCAHTLPCRMRSGPSPVGGPSPPLLQGRERGTARLPRSPGAPRPSAARRWKSMNVCFVRRDRLASGALLLVGKGGEKKGSLRTPPHVLASGRATRRCRSGGNGGQAGCQRRREEPYPRCIGLIAWQASSAVRHGSGRRD